MPISEMPANFFSLMPLMMLVMGVLIVVPFWSIFQKAGQSKWLSVLMIIPGINIILIYYLAFSEWPRSTGTT